MFFYVHRLSEFLADAAQRIMILEIVFKRVINRYHKLLLYMGIPLHFAKDMKVNSFCKIVSEFALEYRTTREKVMQQLAKKANQRERKKTRGKMIVDVSTVIENALESTFKHFIAFSLEISLIWQFDMFVELISTGT